MDKTITTNNGTIRAFQFTNEAKGHQGALAIRTNGKRKGFEAPRRNGKELSIITDAKQGLANNECDE